MSKLRFLGLMSTRHHRGGGCRSRRRGPPPGNHPQPAGADPKLVKKLGTPQTSGRAMKQDQTGYVLYWQLAALGVKCEVVAPSLVPTKAGDRVRPIGAMRKLARSHRSGDLTAVWVPDAGTKLCGTWFAHARTPNRISCERGSVWASFLTHGKRSDGSMKTWTAK